MQRTEAYRRDLRRVEYGDERDPKIHDFFEKIAPLNNAGCGTAGPGGGTTTTVAGAPTSIPPGSTEVTPSTTAASAP